MDIAEFLIAQLDEEEAIARHAILQRENRDRWQVGDVTYRDDYAFVSICTPDGVEIVGSGFDGTGGVHGEVFATHIARHDPARVLADITAKRELIAIWQRMEDSDSTEAGWFADKILEQLLAPYGKRAVFTRTGNTGPLSWHLEDISRE